MVGKFGLIESGIAQELLDAPHSLRHQADFGCQYGDFNTPGQHKDGCGVAWIEHGKIQIEKRAKKDAWDESFIARVRRINSPVFIAHNRLASMGLEPSIDGSHPFMVSDRGRDFALCHNGSIKTFRHEAESRGTSDSRILLEHLVIPGQSNDGDAIKQRVRKIATETDYTSMSALLITNSELFVWRIFKLENEAEVRERYYTLYLKTEANCTTVASEKLDSGAWELLQNGEFLRVHQLDGKIKVERSNLLLSKQAAAA